MNERFLTACEKELGPDILDAPGGRQVIAPWNDEALGTVVRLAASSHLGVHPVGGGTVPMSDPPVDSAPVWMGRFDDVSEVDGDDFVTVCGAGATVDRVVDEAAAVRLYLPLELDDGDVATMGGAYMTAASGATGAVHGGTRDLVLGVTCVNARGDIVRFGGRTAKNVSGFDMTRFLAGSMGLFAVVTRMTLKARPLPEVRRAVAGVFGTGAAALDAPAGLAATATGMTSLELVASDGLRGRTTVLAGFEGMDRLVGHAVTAVMSMMHGGDAEEVLAREHEDHRDFRRAMARTVPRSGGVMLRMASPAVPSLLRRVAHDMPEMPVHADCLSGRCRFLPTTSDDYIRLERTSSALGGTRPAAWDTYSANGFRESLTGPERALILSLKRELDPDGILNPHLLRALS